MSKENSRNELRYVEEHITCKNYAINTPLLRIINLPAGKVLKNERMENSALVFVLKGSVSISTGIYINEVIMAGNMFFIPNGDGIHKKGMADSVLLYCYLKNSMALCNEFSLRQLSQYIHLTPENLAGGGFATLPIADLLVKELVVTTETMETNLLCHHFLEVKRDIFLLMLRGFYSKEELAYLFKPVLSEDFDFKKLILRNYIQGANVQTLIDLSGLSTATFNRKFRNAFGMSAGQWLISKKKENILKDLLMTGLTLKEIAQKHNFTSNYLINFCKTHFGSTPLELRESNK